MHAQRETERDRETETETARELANKNFIFHLLWIFLHLKINH